MSRRMATRQGARRVRKSCTERGPARRSGVPHCGQRGQDLFGPEAIQEGVEEHLAGVAARTLFVLEADGQRRRLVVAGGSDVWCRAGSRARRVGHFCFGVRELFVDAVAVAGGLVVEIELRVTGRFVHPFPEQAPDRAVVHPEAAGDLSEPRRAQAHRLRGCRVHDRLAISDPNRRARRRLRAPRSTPRSSTGAGSSMRRTTSRRSTGRTPAGDHALSLPDPLRHARVLIASKPTAARAATGRLPQTRSKRSRFITLSHAAMKSRTNFSFASSLP